MLQITTGTTNGIDYISRFNEINKFELIAHDTKEIYSEEGLKIVAWADGRITHSGLTFNFKPNTLYTYSSYFLDTINNKYYLAHRSLLKTWHGDERIDNYVEPIKTKNTFKTKK